MQIKPSTARERSPSTMLSRVPKTISMPAPNPSRRKVSSFLADTYIAEAGVVPREQVLMALAAYNAGPGHLKRFRDYATKHGLDPNRRFGNVENGAAAIIGQETVGCIGNIHKYYIVCSARQKARSRKRRIRTPLPVDAGRDDRGGDRSNEADSNARLMTGWAL